MKHLSHSWTWSFPKKVVQWLGKHSGNPKYLYIPSSSCHPNSTKGLIRGEGVVHQQNWRDIAKTCGFFASNWPSALSCPLGFDVSIDYRRFDSLHDWTSRVPLACMSAMAQLGFQKTWDQKSLVQKKSELQTKAKFAMFFSIFRVMFSCHLPHQRTSLPQPPSISKLWSFWTANSPALSCDSLNSHLDFSGIWWCFHDLNSPILNFPLSALRTALVSTRHGSNAGHRAPWINTLGSGRIKRIYRHLIFGSACRSRSSRRPSTEPFTASPTEVVRPDRRHPMCECSFQVGAVKSEKWTRAGQTVGLELQIFAHLVESQILHSPTSIKYHQRKFSWTLPSYRVNKKWGESERKRNSKKE